MVVLSYPEGVIRPKAWHQPVCRQLDMLLTLQELRQHFFPTIKDKEVAFVR